MVVCIVALVVLCILSIFSAKYRPMAKEAARCVARMVTLRPCQMNFDDKIRAKVTSKLSSKSTRAAGFVYRNFKVLSWIFVVVFVLSTAYTIYGAYNYFVYGSCDPSSPDTCIYNAVGNLVKGNQSCPDYFSPVNGSECIVNITPGCPT